jgi:hypothetical protein
MACKEMVFHFNKKFLEDPQIPMWVIKAKGKTMYVNHVECNVPWSTKETSDNSHTKGSIKVKDCLLQIDYLNEAKILPLTLTDKVRLKNAELGITRIIFYNTSFEKIIKEEKIKHSPFKTIHGSCGSKFTICDLLDQQQLSWLMLKYDTKVWFRVLQPNEQYYQAYDDPKLWEEVAKKDIDEPEYDEDDEDDENE